MSDPSLTDFLLARIAEDERRVEFVRGFIPDEGDQGEYIDPARMLAECEAKRQIVGYYTEALGDGTERDVVHAYADALEALALPYADHDDYREEFKP